MTVTSNESVHKVNFSTPRGFATTFKSDAKETLFPDDPFRELRNQPPLIKSKKILEYFVPIFQWLPKYNFRLFRYDILAGITIASLAIPQGISYAKLANIPPVIGLYSSFVPPIIYAVFGSSKDIAIGNVAAASLLLAETIESVVSEEDNPTLYLHLIFTATFFTGIYQAALGIFRLGILIDFLSHSTIVGFMSGTATIIGLQQLKGILGLKKFTKKTDVVSVLRSVFTQTREWRWESAVAGIVFLTFLLVTRYVKKKNPKLFWVSAIGPIVVVVAGCITAYFFGGDKHGITTVGPLHKGINPPSITLLNFNSKYLATVIKGGLITGTIALAEGVAIGRSFAVLRNEQIDGNKEMIAFGMMNLIGSFTSCYLTTGPFSKTAVNYNAGCKTPMSNIVMAICMLLVLLFLAPIFSYTPLVALSAIILAAMLGLIEYEEAYRLFKVDKFDFCIAMTAFLGVAFLSMDIGIVLSVGLAIVRTLLYVARPAITKLGKIPNSAIYCDVQQYPSASEIPGVLILQLGSPVYFANCSYVRERITRWIVDEGNTNEGDLEHVIIDMGGVLAIDTSGLEMLREVQKIIEKKGMKVSVVNPRLDVAGKLKLSNIVEILGEESMFLSIGDAIDARHFHMSYESRQTDYSQSNEA